MENFATIEIEIKGKKGNNELSAQNFDIREIRNILDYVEDMLYPYDKKGRPEITYRIEEGSVKNTFTTSKQAVVAFTGFLGILSTASIDALELPTAKAFENVQRQAREKNYTFEFSTSENNSKFIISPTTNYERSANLLVDAEFYFYGILTNAGGKKDANIHLDTKEVGSLTIAATKDFLEKREENMLYKPYGVKVKGKQHAETGEIDHQNLELIDLIDYSPKYDEDYLNRLIEKASSKFINIDADALLADIRGGGYYNEK